MMKNGFSQLKKLLPLVAMSAIVLAVGCSDDDPTKPPEEFAPPSNLTFANNEQFDRIDLSWTASPDAGANDFAGYNIYQSTTSLAGMTGAEVDSLKIAGGPFTTTSRSVSVPVGVKYYFSVRAVKDNDDLSEAANEVDTALPDTGEDLAIVEFADKSGNSGVDLSEGTTYSVMIENLVHIDFFLGTTDDDNDPGFALALKSPHLIGGPNAAQWATRQASFKVIDDENASSTTSAGFIDSITLTAAELEDKAIVVRLPNDEGGQPHYGKISKMEFDGEPGNRTMLFSWTYQPVNNYLRF